jgi:transposase
MVQVMTCQAQVTAIQALTDQIGQLDRQLRQRVAQQAPSLPSLPGCGPLTAAKLIAETAGVARFRSEACFAMHAGVAPIPVSSGRTDRHRLSRGGNRQLNAALHRIAITQLRLSGPGQRYYQRRRAQGDGPARPSGPSSAASPAPSTSDSERLCRQPTSSTRQPLDRGAT